MMDWYTTMETFPKIYWTIALSGSLIFIITLILSLLGGETDLGDVDTEIETDTGIGFQFLTFKNLVGFFTIFGWSGIASMDAGLSKPLTILISFFCGLIMMALMATMFHYMKKLNDSGTLDYKNAINSIGEVYLTVGKNRSSIGKVHINVQGSLRELEAITDESLDLKPGSVISVTQITANGILIIKKQS